MNTVQHLRALAFVVAAIACAPTIALAYGPGPQPAYYYHPPSHNSYTPPPPEARYSIGNQYYGKEDLKDILMADPASSPFIEASVRLSSKGTGLVVGGLILMPIFVLGGTLMMTSFVLDHDIPIAVSMGAGMGMLAIGLGIGIPMMAVGSGKKKAAGREFNKGINAYNAAHPDAPIVIEQDYGYALAPFLLPGGGGLSLRAKF